VTARLRQTATLGPRVAKQADLKSPPPLYQQRARERRRAMAVSAAAMLFITASLATIVLVRANNERDEEALIAAAEQAEKPAPKLVKTQPVKPASTANATAAPTTETAPVAVAAAPAVQPTAAKPTAATAAVPIAVPEVGDGGPVPVDVAAAQQQAQAFADVQANANAASKALEEVAEGNLPAELTAAIPTPRPTDARGKTADVSDEAEVEVASAAQAAAPKGNAARILRDVTMRASGSKNAAPVGTIPARATVELISCKSWCQVVYKGKRGWIYKGFVDR